MVAIYQTSKVRAGRGTISPAPAAPASVTATKTANNEITLVWQDPADQTALQYYRVYRSNGGAYSQIGTAAPVAHPATRTYVDSVADTGTYTYRVSCYSVDEQESAQTQSGSVVITDPAPVVVFGWKSYVTDPFSIGSYVVGTNGQYALLPLVTVPAGTTVQFARLSSTSPLITVDSGTGVLSVPSGLTEGAYSVAVSVTDGASTYSRTFTLTVSAYTGNWATRIAGPDVIAYHNFANQNEVDYHLDMSNNAVTVSSGSPGGYTLNKRTSYGTAANRVHDPRLNAYRVVDANTSSGYAMEIRLLGARLAVELTPTATSMVVDDATHWPDPNNDPSKYYFVAVHADETNPQFAPANAISGSKGWKEYVTVKKVTGNTITFAGRGHTYSESNQGGRPQGNVDAVSLPPTNSGALIFEITPSNFSSANDSAWQIVGSRVDFLGSGTPLVGEGYYIASAVWQPNGNLRVTTTAQAKATPDHGNGCVIVPAGKRFLVGCPTGKDIHGGWGRPLSALNAASTGRGVADPAANNTVPIRSKSPRATMTEGYYADTYYHTHSDFRSWPAQTPSAFDGDEFWIQFMCYIDPARRNEDVSGGKLFFIDPHSGGGQQQIVGAGPDEYDGTAYLFGDFGGERFNPDNYFQPITNTTTGATTSNYPLCRVGSLNPASCYQWPLGEWFTCMIRVKPGYSHDVACPALNTGDDTANDLTVDTTYYAPTNNGTQLVFETTLPKLFRYLPNTNNPGPDGGTFNRLSPGYFSNGGWQMTWPTSTNGTWPSAANQFAGGVALCAGADIVTHAGGVQRMRWTFVRKGSTPFTSGVPSTGHKMQMESYDKLAAFPQSYRKHELDMWVKRAGQAPVQIYGLKNYMIVFGTGANKYSANPPAFSEFKPTGYSNVWDNLAPHPLSTFYRFADIIFSKSTIPWPN